jgi:phage terminase small subunit
MAMKKEEKLSPREELFILHYLESKNATDACVKAGYTKNRQTAATLGWRLLRKDDICQIIDTALNEQMKKLGLDQASWLANLMDCANTTKRDKLRSDAIKMLGDHFGFFNPKPASDAGADPESRLGRVQSAADRARKK